MSTPKTAKMEYEILATVEDKTPDSIKSGANTGKVYYSYKLNDVATGESAWYKQFSEVTTAEPVQPGEMWRFKVEKKPSNNGGIFLNVTKVLGKAETVGEGASPTSLSLAETVAAVAHELPTLPQVASFTTAPTNTIPTSPKDKSIERQVAVKASVDLAILRERLLHLAFDQMPGELGLAEGESDPRYTMADAMWAWVTKTKPTEIATQFAAWMQS